MSNFFDKGLHYIGKNSNDVFVINIGAMDGVMFDEMIGYTNMYNFKGLYVEPIPYLFDKLKKNLNDSNYFENSAISDYNGTIEMLTIDRDVIDKGLVHNCFYGMSAVYPPKNGLGSEGDRETVEKYGKIVEVNCIRFETLLNKHNITNFDVLKIDAEGHDFKIFKQIDLSLYKPSIVRIEWINLNEEEQLKIEKEFQKNEYKYEINGQDIVALRNDLYDKIFKPEIKNNSRVTLVTGIWDIKRDTLSEGWNRNFEHYLKNLEKLMKTEDNMIIFIESKYKDFVQKNRSSKNTHIVIRELDWFKSNKEIFDNIQKIRNDPNWYNQVGWLKDSTQSKLEMYNPIVMSKMFLMNDASILDPFDSTHLVWIDGGITNTIHDGYFWKDKVIKKLDKYFNKFSFVCFPYDGKVEIHGFEYKSICKYAESQVNKVARGGIFGGPKHTINEINNIYYSLLVNTLSNGYMGTEESIFTIMTYKYPELIQYYEIENNGLLGTFFENLKNDKLEVKHETRNKILLNGYNKDNTGLYVLTYNSPSQFEKLCISFLEYDRNFYDKPKKYLVNNSIDTTTFEEYDNLCQKFGFEEIHKDNIGICGGRQFIAEHADENNFDFHFFFEDDMFFYMGDDEFCRNGFRRKIKNFYNLIFEITIKENFDFLKWNFTEFFGDNSKQWSWHNVPQQVREQLFPERPYKTENDTGKEPYLNFKHIKSHKGLPYATGEIYYCNWPQIVTKHGNKKMFLETKWAHPFEQTWMSHIYQETIKNNINPGILLATPTEHNRFEFYPREERKES